jgi:hypothetical protein
MTTDDQRKPSPTDFTCIVFAGKVFGDGATMEIEEADRWFRDRLIEIDQGVMFASYSNRSRMHDQ